MKIIPYAEPLAKGIREIGLNANSSIPQMGQSGNELIDFDKITEVTNDCLKSFAIPALNRKIVELHPNRNGVELSKGWLKERLSGRQLQYNSVNKPWALKRKVFHC